jgi:hypothetical protein
MLLDLLVGEIGDREHVAVIGAPHTSVDLVAAVELADAHVHARELGPGDVLADEVGPDRHLAVAAVDQHRDLDRARPAEPAEDVERDPTVRPGREHVVDEHRPRHRRSRTHVGLGPSMRSRGSSTSSR